MDLKALYTQLILDESRNPCHRYKMDRPTCCGVGKNPSCGDHLELQMKLDDGEKKIEKVSFIGEGCAISQASASIMSELLEGKTVEEARDLLHEFIRMIRDGEVEDDAEDRLEDAVAFQDIANMPARVRCAVLAWHTALNLLGEDDDSLIDDDRIA